MVTVVLENKYKGREKHLWLSRLKTVVTGLKRWLFSQILSVQASGPEFGPQKPCKKLGFGVSSCDSNMGMVEA